MNAKIIIPALLAILCIGCSNRLHTVSKIGGADGPTTIFVSGKSPEKDSTFLPVYGLQLTQQMQQLANDSDLMATLPGKSITPLLQNIGKQRYDTPRKIFAIRNLRTKKMEILLSQSSCTKPLIADRILRSIPAQLNAQSGSDVLAATSLLYVEDVFHFQGLKEYTFYLYLYDGNYHSMVLYRPTKEYIVQANASFVLHPKLGQINTTDEMKQFFTEILNMPLVEIEEVTL